MHSEALCCLLRLLETYIEEIIKMDSGENRRCGLIAGGSRRTDRVTGLDIVSGLSDSYPSNLHAGLSFSAQGKKTAPRERGLVFQEGECQSMKSIASRTL